MLAYLIYHWDKLVHKVLTVWLIEYVELAWTWSRMRELGRLALLISSQWGLLLLAQMLEKKSMLSVLTRNTVKNVETLGRELWHSTRGYGQFLSYWLLLNAWLLIINVSSLLVPSTLALSSVCDLRDFVQFTLHSPSLWITVIWCKAASNIKIFQSLGMKNDHS